MRVFLGAAAILWPALLSAAVVERVRAEAPAFTTAIYVIASRVCHQRPERTFETRGVKWPVCGRCSGLYLAAPAGALLALLAVRRGARVPAQQIRLVIGLAALPTLVTLVLEWTGAVSVTSGWRAFAAVPLGAAIAWSLIAVVSGPDEPIG